MTKLSLLSLSAGPYFLARLRFSLSLYHSLCRSPLHISFRSVHSAAEALNVNTHTGQHHKKRRIFLKLIRNFNEKVQIVSFAISSECLCARFQENLEQRIEKKCAAMGASHFDTLESAYSVRM